MSMQMTKKWARGVSTRDRWGRGSVGAIMLQSSCFRRVIAHGKLVNNVS